MSVSTLSRGSCVGPWAPMATVDIVVGGGGCGGGRVAGGGGAEVEEVGGTEVAGGGPDIADTRLVGARVPTQERCTEEEGDGAR